MFSSLLGVVIGGLITFFVSKCFYVKAAEELKQKTSIIAHLIKGNCEPEFDAQGMIIGYIITLRVGPFQEQVRVGEDVRVVIGKEGD
jgi:hypothetical protein